MKKHLLALILSTVALTGCHQPSIKGNVYTLSTSPQGMPITLAFDNVENKYYGKALNNYFGTYEINGNKITLNAGGMTQMAGASAEMEAEHAYFKDLSNVERFKIAEKYLILILKNDKELLFQKTGQNTNTQ